MMNFNEVSRTNVTYENIKSYQKSWLHGLSRKNNFEKRVGVKFTLSAFLGLTM